jgi:hypothetical protein
MSAAVTGGGEAFGVAGCAQTPKHPVIINSKTAGSRPKPDERNLFILNPIELAAANITG